MYLNTTPPTPPRKACIRDMHELLHQHLTPQLVMLAPLEQLQRRLFEITAQHPRFQEEAPLVLTGEAQRRQRLSGELVVATHRAQDIGLVTSPVQHTSNG